MAYKYAIPTMSLGRAWHHQLPHKLDTISREHFSGVEIFYEDLEYHAKALPGGISDSNLLLAASEIRKLCDERHLEIIALQPFMFYEGLTDKTEHAKRIEKLALWFQIVKKLGTVTIQIPSNFLAEGITGDHDLLVSDMRELADLGSQQTPVVRFVYENLCWGKYVSHWEHAWDIVSAVDRPNFGICLDTFNIAGGVWADPSRPDGKVVNADEKLRESLKRMKERVDVNKVFYVQVVDAERLSDPIVPGHAYYIEDQDSRMGWSRNARVLPFEEPGYLPWMDVLKAITEPDGLNFKGWISFELFSRTMSEADASVPSQHAKRMVTSKQKLVDAMGW